MPNVLEGSFTVHDTSFAIVASRFNSFIVEQLVAGALDALRRHQISEDNITVVYCPGSYEIPLIVKKLAASGTYSGVIALGCVIRGATPHFDFVAGEVAKGVAGVMLSTEVPCIFGVLTTDTIEQAIERAGTKAGNKGYDAAMAALEMASLMEQLKQ